MNTIKKLLYLCWLSGIIGIFAAFMIFDEAGRKRNFGLLFVGLGLFIIGFYLWRIDQDHLIRVYPHLEDSLELSDETKQALADADEDIRMGRVVTLDQMKKDIEKVKP